MNDLKTTTAIVRAILEQDEHCRNSDSFLYLKVLSVLGDKQGIDIDSMSVPYFLLNMQGTAFPGFETVRRSRQKIQQHQVHLGKDQVIGEHIRVILLPKHLLDQRHSADYEV